MKILIYYFTGTGNTALCAEALAKSMTGQGAEVDIHPIEAFNHSEIPDPGSYDRIGIGYPVHAWNAPNIVFHFIKRLPLGDGKMTFLFNSVGDPFLDGGATVMLRKALNRQGYRVFHESSFVMGANILVSYPDEMVKQLYFIAVKRAEKFASEILQGVERYAYSGILRRIITGFVSGLEHFGVKMIGILYGADKTCDLCGVCVKACPTGNISVKGQRIRFGFKCELCMRCVNKCPKFAIKPFPGFFKLKTPYRPRKVIRDASIKGNILNRNGDKRIARMYEYMMKELGYVETGE